MTRDQSAYARTLGIQRVKGENGLDLLWLPYSTQLLGRPGFLHGGAIAGFLALVCDDAMERQVRPEMPRFNVLSSSLQFLRGGSEHDMFAEASIQVGWKIASVNAAVWQKEKQKPIASIYRKYLLREDAPR